jgi:hypothetical protein
MADIGDALDEARRIRHAEWYEENMTALRLSGLIFVEQGTAVLFREPGKPCVDFYPHTGRWRIVGTRVPARTKSGGARAFLSWYARQEAP